MIGASRRSEPAWSSRGLLAIAAAALAACAGGPRLRSADLELIAERPADGRATPKALALAPDGSWLACGTQSGHVEVVALPGFEPIVPAPPLDAPPDPCGDVLAMHALGPRDLAWVMRDGTIRRDPLLPSWGIETLEFDSFRLSGAAFSRSSVALCWSVPRRVCLTLGPSSWSIPFEDSTVASIHRVADDLAVRCAGAGERSVAVVGTSSSNGLELMCCMLHPDRVDHGFRRALHEPAHALAVDEAAERIVIAGDGTIDLVAFRDGERLHRIEAEATALHAFGDGRRVLIVNDEWNNVLHLDDPPRVEAGFLSHRGGVTAVAVSADGTTLVTGGARGDLLVFRILPAPPLPGSNRLEGTDAP